MYNHTDKQSAGYKMDWNKILDILVKVVTSPEVIIIVLAALVYIKLVIFISNYKKRPKREKVKPLPKNNTQPEKAKDENDEDSGYYEEKSYNDDEYV